MESKYNYFKRDISWLSFNYRVLLEALDERLPLYERINFISIYSSNLEEFYKIRVADHKAVASGATESDEETVQSARELVEEINKEVTRQLDDRVRIYEQKILPALRKNHIIFYQDNHVEPFHQQFIKDFFREEIFPYLQPVPVSKDKIVSFLRDNRLYLAIRVYPKKEEKNKGEEPKENIEKYKKMFKINELIDKKVNDMSLGQKQLIAIVTALISNCKYMFLDEPTNGLDLETKCNLVEVLKKIKQDEDHTIVITTHDLEFLLSVADECVVMDRGKIIKSINLDNEKFESSYKYYKDSFLGLEK